MKKYILTTVLLCVFCLIMSYSAQVLATEVSEPITDDTALDTMETTSEEKFTPQWIKKGKYYYYQQSDGSILQDSGIVKIGKYKYCLGKNGKYNCYGFACTFASFAKELGYEPYVIVMEEDHAVVMIDGKYYDNMGGRFGVNEPALSNFKIYKKVKF